MQGSLISTGMDQPDDPYKKIRNQQAFLPPPQSSAPMTGAPPASQPGSATTPDSSTPMSSTQQAPDQYQSPDLIGTGVGTAASRGSTPDPQAQARQIMGQQSGSMGTLQPIAPSFGASQPTDAWGQMRPRFMANGGLKRRTMY